MKLRLLVFVAGLAALLSVLPALSVTQELRYPALAWVTASHEQESLLESFDVAHDREGDEIQVVLWDGDLERLEKLGLRYRIEDPDLERTDREAGVGAWKPEVAGARTTYRVLADYEKELRDLGTAHPDRVLHFTAPFKTLEGRGVHGVIVGTDVTRFDGRPTALVMALHHAREWPSSELTMDFAHELVTGQTARIKAIRDNVKTVIIPIVNPDGFNISREAMIDEDLDHWPGSLLGVPGVASYWRKNARAALNVPELGTSAGAYGVDNNRNYAYQWGSGSLMYSSAASSNPLVQTYQGPAPFSEPETQNIRAIVLTNNVTTLLTNHTSGDLVLRPWGHTRANPPDLTQLKQLGDQLAASNGSRSQRGIDLYATTGTTEDWSYATTGGFGYTFEIGSDGFHPPYSSSVPQLWSRFRDSFFRLAEAATTSSYHSIVTGTVKNLEGAPLNAKLRLTKTVQTPLYLNGDGSTPTGARFHTDTIDLFMETGPTGAFTWHVNPSTRPIASGTESYTLTITAPGHAAATQTVTVARGQTLPLGTITLNPA